MTIKELLDGFVEIHNREVNNRVDFERFLDGFVEARKSRIRSQRTTADDINVFEILDFKYDEVRHSKFLAWLLNPELEHAQGSLFFKYFLEYAELPVEYAKKSYKVETEVRHDESQIDIEIKGDKSEFLIHIENKVNAAEGEKQLERETRDLEKKRVRYRVKPENTHALYLTPSGELPENARKFKALSWRQVAQAIKTFEDNAKAERAKWVAEQYLYVVENYIIRMKEE